MSAAQRLDIRLPETEKSKIAKAAQYRGLSVSAYTLQAVVRAAETDIRTHDELIFNAEESAALVASLSQPFLPNPRLAEALRIHQARDVID